MTIASWHLKERQKWRWNGWMWKCSVLWHSFISDNIWRKFVSKIWWKWNSNGGTLQCQTYLNMFLEGNAAVDFIKNNAGYGRAISQWYSLYDLTRKSGGAIFLMKIFCNTNTKSNAMFYYNMAACYCGAIYGQMKQDYESKIVSNITGIDFSNNTALDANVNMQTWKAVLWDYKLHTINLALYIIYI